MCGRLAGGSGMTALLVANRCSTAVHLRVRDRVPDFPARCGRSGRRSDRAVRAPVARRRVVGRRGAGLEEHYDVPLGGIGINYYRDGRDSVAPHRDRELRHLDDTLIAIVTLGARRPFLIRPKGGGKSRDISPASGDLLVMGGRTQVGW